MVERGVEAEHGAWWGHGDVEQPPPPPPSPRGTWGGLACALHVLGRPRARARSPGTSWRAKRARPCAHVRALPAAGSVRSPGSLEQPGARHGCRPRSAPMGCRAAGMGANGTQSERGHGPQCHGNGEGQESCGERGWEGSGGKVEGCEEGQGSRSPGERRHCCARCAELRLSTFPSWDSKATGLSNLLGCRGGFGGPG